jgi:hypothetical protein
MIEARNRMLEPSLSERLITDELRRDSALRAMLARPAFEDTHAKLFNRWLSSHKPLGLDTYQSAFAEANRVASLVEQAMLPTAMERFRTPFESMTEKMLGLESLDVLNQPTYREAFARASAISDLISESSRVSREFSDVTRLFAGEAVPTFGSLSAYRGFLDAAGLRLPHWPRRRLLSKAEKRKRFKAKLRENTEPTHVKKAKSLVHRYELTLREILDDVMATEYGERWPEERLPLCDCNDLLGRWRKRGGEVLDHADFAHYARIMSHPEHFQAIFEAGFDDPGALAELLNTAGSLRAQSHHGRVFTPENLRDLRLTWRSIETGLLAFTDDYELSY